MFLKIDVSITIIKRAIVKIFAIRSEVPLLTRAISLLNREKFPVLRETTPRCLRGQSLVRSPYLTADGAGESPAIQAGLRLCIKMLICDPMRTTVDIPDELF